MNGQIEALVALDDWYIALQRIRDVVAAAETYRPTAFRASINPLWRDARQAQARLLSALDTLKREATNESKPVEITDYEGHVIGWQETILNGNRAARVFMIGEAVTIALTDSQTGQGQQEVPLCSCCQSIVAQCPQCEAQAHPSPVCVGDHTWTEFHCSSCDFRFPDDGSNGLCRKCLNAARRQSSR